MQNKAGLQNRQPLPQESIFSWKHLIGPETFQPVSIHQTYLFRSILYMMKIAEALDVL